MAAARFEQWGVPCASSLGTTQATLLTPFARAMYMLGDSARAFIPASARPTGRGWPEIDYDPNTPVTIPARSLDALRQGFLRDAQLDGSILALRAGPAAALARADSLMRPRVWKDGRNEP